MFGYVKTDFPNLYVKDTVLYKSLYCGLCKSIGSCCGQKGRFLLSYDLTFLSLFIHNICDCDIEINREHCAVHRFTKRPVAKTDKISQRIACLNVIMAYHKLNDDVMDNGKGRLKKSFFKNSYIKAKKREPVLDEIVLKRFNRLIEYERNNISAIDIAADPFGLMLSDIVKELTGDLFNEDLYTVSYNLGKWIYLIDALDDFDKDIKNNNFNVFVNCYTQQKDKESFIKENKKELEQIFGEVLSEISNASSKLNYKFNYDLITNIFNLGLKKQTMLIMENKKCKNISKF